MALLYEEGVEHVAFVEGFSEATGSATKEADHLFAEATRNALQTGDAERTWVTDAAVDLTNVDTLVVDWAASESGATPTRRVSLVASTLKASDHDVFDTRLDLLADFARTEQTLDVSALSGNHFLRVHAYLEDAGAAQSGNSTVQAFVIKTVGGRRRRMMMGVG